MAEKAVPTILVGKKPLMNYVFACLTTLQTGQSELVVKARGRAISRAIDIVQILKNRFYKDLQIKNIQIGTEEVVGQGNRTVSVSTIEITLARE